MAPFPAVALRRFLLCLYCMPTLPRIPLISVDRSVADSHNLDRQLTITAS